MECLKNPARMQTQKNELNDYKAPLTQTFHNGTGGNGVKSTEGGKKRGGI